jgi:CopG family transcriptional regulator, nickel-responsive regulator
MSETVKRYSIAVPRSLMDSFDSWLAAAGRPSRSEAIRDLMRAALVRDRWEAGDEEVMGSVTVVYDHHQRELGRRLTALQHEAHDQVICTTHVHLDHHHCLEVIVLRGRASQVRTMADAILGTRGVLHGELVCTAVGEPACSD